MDVVTIAGIDMLLLFLPTASFLFAVYQFGLFQSEVTNCVRSNRKQQSSEWTSLPRLSPEGLEVHEQNLMVRFGVELSDGSASYHFFDLSLGGGFRGIRNSALMGCMSHRAAQTGGTERQPVKHCSQRVPLRPVQGSRWRHLRGAPSAISRAVMPRDHRSLWKREADNKVTLTSFLPANQLGAGGEGVGAESSNQHSIKTV